MKCLDAEYNESFSFALHSHATYAACIGDCVGSDGNMILRVWDFDKCVDMRVDMRWGMYCVPFESSRRYCVPAPP